MTTATDIHKAAVRAAIRAEIPSRVIRQQAERFGADPAAVEARAARMLSEMIDSFIDQLQND